METEEGSLKDTIGFRDFGILYAHYEIYRHIGDFASFFLEHSGITLFMFFL